MNRLGYCAPCAAGNPISLLGQHKGLGDWYSELKDHLQPMMPWIIGASALSAFIGFKLGKWYYAGLCLDREVRVVAAPKKRRKK